MGRRAIVWLGAATAIGMFVVLIMGDFVTNTGSAQGCGHDWPLCRGQFIPEFTLATAIEYSHRVVTAIESCLLIAFAALALSLRRERPALKWLIPIMITTLFLQAGMGAWAVKYPQVAVVLALHFGISLAALASASLAAFTVREAVRGDPPRQAAPAWLLRSSWGLLLYLYLLVYSGAYIRHLGAAEACQSWPGCSGSGWAVALDLAHRVGAALAVVGVLGLIWGISRLGRPRPDLISGAWVLLAALGGQGVAGAYLVRSDFALSGEMLHAGVTGAVFTAAAWLCLKAYPAKAQLEPEPALTVPVFSR